jgi:hypothetical protein
MSGFSMQPALGEINGFATAGAFVALMKFVREDLFLFSTFGASADKRF